METWTDDQLQAQLDEWTRQICNGGVPNISLTTTPSTHYLEFMGYTLCFNDVAIKLARSQAQCVMQWMNACCNQFQANKLASMLPVVPNETQQNMSNKPRDTQFATESDMNTQKIIGRGITRFDVGDNNTYESLGKPVSCAEWHKALLLPDDYVVEYVHQGKSWWGDRPVYEMQIASEHIPVPDPPVRVTLTILYTRINNGNINTTFLSEIACVDEDGNTIARIKTGE